MTLVSPRTIIFGFESSEESFVDSPFMPISDAI